MGPQSVPPASFPTDTDSEPLKTPQADSEPLAATAINPPGAGETGPVPSKAQLSQAQLSQERLSQEQLSQEQLSQARPGRREAPAIMLSAGGNGPSQLEPDNLTTNSDQASEATSPTERSPGAVLSKQSSGSVAPPLDSAATPAQESQRQGEQSPLPLQAASRAEQLVALQDGRSPETDRLGENPGRPGPSRASWPGTSRSAVSIQIRPQDSSQAESSDPPRPLAPGSSALSPGPAGPRTRTPPSYARPTPAAALSVRTDASSGFPRSASVGSQETISPDEPTRLTPSDVSGEPLRDQMVIRSGEGVPGAKQLEGPQEARVILHRQAPAEVQVNQPLTVELILSNVGQTAAENVELWDEIPRGSQLINATPAADTQAGGRLFWRLGSLAPGEETTIRLSFLPAFEGTIGSVARVTYSTEATSATTVTRPRLSVEVQAPKTVLIDEEVTLVIKVSNTGTGTAKAVTIREIIPPGLRHPAGEELEYTVGDLKPGEIREAKLTLRAVQPGRATNQLLASGANNLQADPEETEIEILAPGLAVAIDGPKRRFLERPAKYQLTVSNPGTASARQVKLRALLPEGTEFADANANGRYDPATRTVRWRLEELPPKRNGTVTLSVVPRAIGIQSVRAEVSADRGLSDRAVHETAVEGVAAVLFQVADVADPIEVGGQTVYEIRVTNQGTKAAEDIQIVATLPPEMMLVAAEGQTQFREGAGRIFFEPIPRLAPKADIAYRLRVRGKQPGDARLRVELTTKEITEPVTKEESTRIFGDE